MDTRKAGIWVMVATLMLTVGADGATVSSRGLRKGFYAERCPRAEEIVRSVVMDHVSRAPTLAAPILRMLFHDCFVRGCDASVLLNTTDSEKEAITNRSLRGFHVIDAAKAALEKECPGVVSCADVLALSTRDAVVAVGGPDWEVHTGRRDGVVSRRSEVVANIPSPFDGFDALQSLFVKKGLDLTDLVALSGAHTIGTTSCNLATSRMSNPRDPAVDALFAQHVNNKCNSSSKAIMELDPGSFRTFDNHFYANLLKRRAVFLSDSALLSHPSTRAMVALAAASPKPDGWFFRHFALSMQKMASIDVLTGNRGQIRRHCASTN